MLYKKKKNTKSISKEDKYIYKKKMFVCNSVVSILEINKTVRNYHFWMNLFLYFDSLPLNMQKKSKGKLLD